jgi:GR25 family glycosyltransferase involved in LPS biosynthesis
MINVINKNDKFGQCLINVNYSEDTNSANNLWGASFVQDSDINYFIHNHYTEKELEKKCKEANYPNCFYWPHFSFRVGLTKVSVLNEIGPFNESAKHFEMEYAFRYVQNGYKTTFLDGTYCSHIGRRTYERNTDKLNAYDLNNETQFGENRRDINKNGNEESKLSGIKEQEEPKFSELSVYLINLKRRFDRLQSFFTNNKNQPLPPLKIVYGFDGKNMKPTHKIQKAFITGDYNYRSGIIGCAMSHIHIWKRFLETSEKYAVVLEDDIVLFKDFNKKLVHLLHSFDSQSKTFEIVFLHFNPYRPDQKKQYFNQDKLPVAEQWDVQQSMSNNMGSTAAYIISRSGAKNMLRHIEQYGVYNAIDWVMFKSPLDQRLEQRIFYSNPMLVSANCFQGSNGGADTDIQTNYDSLSYNGYDWDKEEFKYLSNHLQNHINNFQTSSSKKQITFVNYTDGFENLNIIPKTQLSKKILQDNINIIICPATNGLSGDEINYTKDYVCIFPIQTINHLMSLSERQSALEFYTTTHFIYTIPHKYMNDDIYKDKVWGSTLLNTVKPF